MKKKLLAMTAGLLMTAALVGAEETSKQESFKFHPWGIFASKAYVASGTIGDSTVSSSEGIFMMIAGLTADYNGTGISLSTRIFAPGVNSVTLPGAAPNFYDLHASFLDGKFHTAIGKIYDDNYYESGTISASCMLGETGLGGGNSMGYNATDGYAYYDPYWGYELTFHPMQNMSIAAWVPVADSDNNELDITDSSQLIDYGLSYQFGSFGRFKGGYLGETKNIYGYFTLTAVKNLVATIGIDENLPYDDISSDDTDDSLSFGFNAQYNITKRFNLVTEDKYVHQETAKDTFEYRGQGEYYLVKNGNLRTRLRFDYTRASSADSFVITPELYIKTINTPVLIDHYLTVGVEYDTINKTWDIPVAITIVAF